MPSASYLLHRGTDDHLHQIGIEGIVDRRDGRIRTHTPGVGTHVAVESPLVILSRRKRQYVAAAHHREQRKLLSHQVFLDDDSCGRLAETAFNETLVQGRLCLCHGQGDDDTLAGRETIGLDDNGGAMLRQVGPRLFVAGECRGPSGGNPRCAHDLLGEGLGTL